MKAIFVLKHLNHAKEVF
nr:BCD2 ORF [Cloning vector pBAMD-tphII]